MYRSCPTRQQRQVLVVLGSTTGDYRRGIHRGICNMASSSSSSSSFINTRMMTMTTSSSYRSYDGTSIVRTISSSSSNHYSPLTKEEEERERERVSTLTEFQKKMELRHIDKQLAILHMKRGINTGTVWTSTFALSYGAIQLGLIDTMAVLQQIDVYTGYDLGSHVDPTLGNIGLAIALNEVMEPIRLPIVIATTKPVVHWLGLGPKY